MSHPPINFAKLPPIDRERLSRALLLGTRKLGNGRYKVIHPTDPLKDPHYVDLIENDLPRCDCGDFTYREQLCKHIIACLLVEHHPVAVDALAEYLSKRMK